MHTFTDPDRGTLHIERYVVEGRSFDVVLARTPDGERVIARAPRLPDDHTGTDLAQWREGLERELEITNTDCPSLVHGASLWNVEEAPAAVIVAPFVEGKRLDAWLADNGAANVDDEAIVRIARDVATAMADMNARGFVHRSPSPDHVIVSSDGSATLIGLGNAARKSEPACLAKDTSDDAYSAPEIHRERSGQFNTPRSDVYAFGMFLSFLATGERPTGEVSAPLTRTAWDRLQERHEGIALLIAKCTQPLQKQRFSSVAKLLPYLTLETLPTPKTEGFGPLALLAPWGRGEPDSLRVGHLSAGPLINRPKAPAEEAPVDPLDTPAPVVETTPIAPAAPMVAPPEDEGPPIVRWVISALVIALALYVLVVTASR